MAVTDPAAPLSTLPTPLLVFGAGGHGRVVADAARRAQPDIVLLASDRDAAKCHGELLAGVPLVVPDDPRVSAVGTAVHVAIGDNRFRALEIQRLGAARLVSVVHPQASVADSARLGPGGLIAAMAVVAPCVVLGQACIVNHGAVLDHDVQVGDHVHIAPRCTVGGGVVMGARVLLGAGSVVLPGLSIADDVVVGAGAVVTQSLTEPGVYVGVPARKKP